MRRVIVYAATGKQGGSVARALLEDKFHVIGVTRHTDSDASRELKDLGATMVKDPEPHLKDADGVFLNLDFFAWYRGNNPDEARDAETAEGKRLVDLCLRSRVKHIVYSTLDHSASHVPHFESKAAVTDYMRQIGAPATNLFTSAYYSNVLGLAKPNHDGTFTFAHPLPDDALIPSYAVEQLGLWARIAFRDPKHWIGKDMPVIGEYVSVAQFAEVFSRVTGAPFETLHSSREEFLANRPSDPEIWLMFKSYMNNEVKRDVAESRALVPAALTFEEWAHRHRDLIRAVVGV